MSSKASKNTPDTQGLSLLHFKHMLSLIQSTDVKQLTLTLKMTTAQVVETSVTCNNNSTIQDYAHPDDHTPATYEKSASIHAMLDFVHFQMQRDSPFST